jgi:hypothetical protein
MRGGDCLRVVAVTAVRLEQQLQQLWPGRPPLNKTSLEQCSTEHAWKGAQRAIPGATLNRQVGTPTTTLYHSVQYTSLSFSHYLFALQQTFCKLRYNAHRASAFRLLSGSIHRSYSAIE